MRHGSHLPLRLAIACAVGILFTLAAFPSTKSNHSKYAGSYESEAGPPGKVLPSISMSLGLDGTATVTQATGKGETTSFGHWVDNGSQVVITFDPTPGKPTEPAMTFQPSHGGLQAVTWNHAEWGKVTPPLAKKDTGSWHAKGPWWTR